MTEVSEIRELLRREPALHLYELGDLDDRFYPHTRYFVRGDLVALLYSPPAAGEPIFVAMGAGQESLIGELLPELPANIYAHLTPPLVDAFAPRYRVTASKHMQRMALTDPAKATLVDRRGTFTLEPHDADEVLGFYRAVYPESWFEVGMLDTGCYVGVRDKGELVAAGGVHIVSASERVAALGNIAVAPSMRGRGLATRITAAVVARVLPVADVVGLNVLRDNAHAIAAYTKVGFSLVGPFEEHRMVARHFTADYVERAVLKDGTAVRLRLLAPEDKQLLHAGFERLSPESRYARFLSPKAELSEAELRYLTEVDGVRHFALGAVAEAGDGAGAPVGLGIARFVRLGDSTVAEAAIAVADAAQGQGLGKLLFLRLVAAAGERGIETFRCELLGANTAMRELIRSIAPDATASVESGVMTIDLPVPQATPHAVASEPHPAATGPMYRLFRAAAENAVEWTEAVRRLWRRQ